jgi:mono/diheme cytochrome c family protein
MKAWCIGVTAALAVVLAVAVLTGATLLRGGIGARPEPSGLESRIARTIRSLAIPDDAKRAVNPLPKTPEVLAEARGHFADHCATCHANDGSGESEIGRRLHPRAPDMRTPQTQELTDGEIFYIIENGVRLTGMPAWGGDGHEEASWGLVHFIRHLPELTAAEKAAMERLNPKSVEEWRELQADDAFLEEGAAPESAPGEHEHEH